MNIWYVVESSFKLESTNVALSVKNISFVCLLTIRLFVNKKYNSTTIDEHLPE